MTDRTAAIATFLTEAGWGAARRSFLAGDASFRRYDRVTAASARAVLMDAPPPHEDVRPFVQVARLLAELGFSAPEILAVDEEKGLLLIEDLGDGLASKLLDTGGIAPETLYELATDTLVSLHDSWERANTAARKDVLPDYDDAKLIDREAMLLPDWYCPAMGIEINTHARQAYADAWRAALAPAHALPRTLVLRDYFPANLVYLPDRSGVRACGLLDFQDAVIGPCAYDLLSLLQDARRDVPEVLETAMLDRYLAARPHIDPTAFRAGYTVLAAQRHAKVIGIFTRLAHRDGKPGYLKHIPRLWRLMARTTAHSALAPVAAWLDAHVPEAARGVPTAETVR